ncbi:PKD domain-containing protein [Flavobacterium aciduliphilum]|nr:PKD domain-containing protein [Flavobacterium aciduliphilum]
MKTIFKSLAMLLMISLFFGCSKDSPAASTSTPAPTVDFIYSGANNPAPSTVSFTSTTTNATNYLWDFGDNSSSTSANPQHLYTAGGVYTVKLTVSGAGGTTSTIKTVNIGAALTHVKISKVTIVNIPFTKPGGTSGWDLDGSGPDIYFQIQDQNSAVLFDATSSNRFSDVTPSMLPFAWNISNPFVITDLTQSRYIELFDYDFGTSDEDMGYVGFLMSNYTTGSNAYPTTVTQTNTTYGITVKLDLIWY